MLPVVNAPEPGLVAPAAVVGLLALG